MTTLKDRFSELAQEKNSLNNLAFTSKALKKLLQQVWPELNFIPRPGYTDLICSSDITVDDAQRKASEFGQAIIEIKQDCQVVDEFSRQDNGCVKEAVLHTAAGIIRDRVLRTLKLE